MSRSKVFLGLGFALLLAVLAAQSFSQSDAPQQRGRGGRGGQGGQGPQGGQMAGPRDGQGQGMRGQRSPEQMRQMMQERMMQRVRQNLNATDEEWAKIEPALTKVMTLSQETEGTGMGFGGRGMRPGGRMRQAAPEGEQAPEPETKLEKARTELRQSLDEGDKEAVQKKLEAFRTARDEAKKELAAAQKQLKETVNVQQEAELVLMGYLD